MLVDMIIFALMAMRYKYVEVAPSVEIKAIEKVEGTVTNPWSLFVFRYSIFYVFFVLVIFKKFIFYTQTNLFSTDNISTDQLLIIVCNIINLS